MTLFQMSGQSFNVASVFYCLAFLLYAGQLVSTKPLYGKGGPWLARAGWAFHTLALVLRWADAGIGHPPWTNLYESLVFFSWGVMSVHIFLEAKFGFRFTGVFATAVVFAAMGVASLHPNKEIEPLVPALQSWWLLFHVFMACIAYSFFLGSSFACVLFLLKDKVKLEVMTAVAAVVCVVFLCIAAGKAFFLSSQIDFFKVTKMAGADGVMKDVIMDFKGPDGRPMQQYVSVPGAPYLLWLLLAFYLGSAAALFGSLARGRARLARTGKALFVAAIAVHFALIVDVFVAATTVTGMALKSNPYRLAAILLTFGIAVFFIYLFRFKDRLVERLPAAKVLDRWGYQAILLGVPFMTLNLISGAVWAYYAWGRYWGWDPKETWALITWFVYVIYLHTRILAGWQGRRTAIISIIGFFIVVFTYLGVNLVISGLHSYATS